MEIGGCGCFYEYFFGIFCSFWGLKILIGVKFRYFLGRVRVFNVKFFGRSNRRVVFYIFDLGRIDLWIRSLRVRKVLEI